MRTLPSNMQARLDSAMQTLYANSDPRLEVIISRQQRWIGAGALLTPATIRTEESLGPIDVAVRREDPAKHLDHLVMAYIEDGVAHTALCYDIEFATDPDYWHYQAEIGPADDVAIEFDGYWTRRAGVRRRLWWELDRTRWTHITEGDPWICRVVGGDLLARQGVGGSDITLSSGDVSQVRALRGWKNVRFPDRDHGLIVAYIKDGDVRYRTRAQQGDLSVVWESAREVAPFDTTINPAANIGLFRTNDYRFGMLAEIDGDIDMTLTDRNWAGMAIDEAKVTADLSSLLVDFIELHYQQGYEDEYIDVSLSALTLDYLWADDIPMLEAENFSIVHEGEDNWGFRIRLTFSHPVENRSGNQAAFAVTDSNMETYSVSATEAGDTPYEVVLRTADFNAAQGLDLTVDYDNTGSLAGGDGTIGQSLGVSSITFTPTDLTGITAEPPEPELIWNE